MSTAEKLDTDSGIGGFRQRIQAIHDNVAKENRRADQLEREREEAHAHYMDKLHRKDMLKVRIEQVRNDILRISKDDIEKRIGVQKGIYAQTWRMIKAAEEKKTKLESQLDDAESKSRDLTSKLKYLNLEHEYQNIESGRKSKDYKDVSETMAAKEKHIEELGDLVDEFKLRIATATDRITDLELRIADTEKEIEKTQWDKDDMQRQFKELIELAKTDLAYFNF